MRRRESRRTVVGQGLGKATERLRASSRSSEAQTHFLRRALERGTPSDAEARFAPRKVRIASASTPSSTRRLQIHKPLPLAIGQERERDSSGCFEKKTLRWYFQPDATYRERRAFPSVTRAWKVSFFHKQIWTRDGWCCEKRVSGDARHRSSSLPRPNVSRLVKDVSKFNARFHLNQFSVRWKNRGPSLIPSANQSVSLSETLPHVLRDADIYLAPERLAWR